MLRINQCKHSLPRIVRAASRSFTSLPRLVETVVHVQEEHQVHELPILVKTVSDIDRQDNVLKEPTQDTKISSHGDEKLLSCLKKCNNTSSILALLQPIPAADITPIIASQTIKKIIKLENNFEIRNPGFRTRISCSLEPYSLPRLNLFTFLLDIVCNSKEPSIIMDTMSSVVQNRYPGQQERIKSKLLEELLLCLVDGLLSLQDTCQAIRVVSSFYPDTLACLRLADLFWPALLDKSRAMTAQESVSLISILPCLTHSRKIVLHLLQEKTTSFADEYTTKGSLHRDTIWV